MALDKETIEMYRQAGIEIPEGEAAPQGPKPLSFEQRLIIQNFFDTQPKRRAAYLKKLGYEMDPSDDNRYRPIGSDGDYAEIDPGFFDTYLPSGELLDLAKKGSLREIGNRFLSTVKEAGQDIGDVAFDVPTGAASGAAALLGTPLGLPGVFLAGAAANAGFETVKAQIGDVFLDEDVPVDMGLVAAQSLMAGALPVMFKGAKAGAKTAHLAWLKSRKDAIVNAAKKSGGGLNEKIIDKAIKNPNMFSPEAVDGATSRLQKTYREIFGIDDPLKLKGPEELKNGMFRTAMQPLNEAAENEMERLAKMPESQFSYEELAGPIKRQIQKYEDDIFNLDEKQKAAYSYLKDKLSSLKNELTTKEIQPAIKNEYGAIVVPEREVERIGKKSFQDTRKWLSAVQRDVLDQDTAGNYVNPYGEELARAFGGRDGILSVLNNKASTLGSSLPEINANRSRIFQAYQSASKVLTPSNIERAFIGDETIAKGQIRDAVGEMDKILGTKLSEQIETGAMQRVIENMYQNPKGFGSGRVNSEIAAQGVEGALKGGLGGAGVGGMLAGGSGAVAGGLTGAALGAARGVKSAADLASPEKALEFIRQQSSRITSLEDELAGGVQSAIARQPLTTAQQVGSVSAGQAIGGAMAPKSAPEEDEELRNMDPEVRKALGL